MTEQVVATFIKEPLSEAALEGLEEHLLESDLGPAATDRIVARFRELRFGAGANEREVKEALAEAVASELAGHEARYQPLDGPRPFVTLFVGVNGTGKTTTIGKIARRLVQGGAKVTLAAGDTFRAAAVEQLRVWAERAGAGFVSTKPNGDAAGLAFEALEKARVAGSDILIIDTAGRLQNKTGLMAELEKIARVIKKLDATVGQNAISQIEAFDRSVPLTGLVMTKLDGTAKGGILVALAARFGLPVHYLGVGEGEDDLQPFRAEGFANALAGSDAAEPST
jgi:fused signal recognition particle receptor